MNDSLKLASVLSLLGLALGIAACGSSDEGTAGEATVTISKAAFIEQGDRICQDNYSKRTQLLTRLNNELFEGNKKPPSMTRQEDILVNRVMPIFWEESEELNELPLPSKGTEEARKILVALENSIEGVEANPGRSIQQGTQAEFRKTEQLARNFGFFWCGRS